MHTCNLSSWLVWFSERWWNSSVSCKHLFICCMEGIKYNMEWHLQNKPQEIQNPRQPWYNCKDYEYGSHDPQYYVTNTWWGAPVGIKMASPVHRTTCRFLTHKILPSHSVVICSMSLYTLGVLSPRLYWILSGRRDNHNNHSCHY